MQKSTFSVNFFIRRTRLGKSGETPIMMRISVDGRYTELSTQRRVPVEQWSQSRCCATGKTAVALEKNYVAPFAHRNAEDFPAVYGRR
ncbi:MAG: hypothetical protein IJW68_03505 [Bacteroidaceae bacterium]|nr:hypothetical protein [Bacteroidaceae bacterium]